MLEKINNYKGVIVFYILLVLILMLISNHNKQIDIQLKEANAYKLAY